MTANANIRNFAIIAHVDHGKSTLADRMLEMTGTVASRDMQAQYLDSMDLERERGITIKANTVRLAYEAKDGQTYQINLIDTPGHVDFAYEVSRSLSACEGCLLVVDAAQGVEAQTLANVYLALENDLEMVPVLNKVDLPGADAEAVREQIEEHIGVDCTHMVLTSAKTGLGVDEVLEAIVKVIPPPAGDEGEPLQMLVIDSWYDQYQGVICLVRVVHGVLHARKQKIRFMSTGNDFEVTGLAVKSPVPLAVDALRAGEVGLMITGIKDINETRVGDTVTDPKNPCDAPLEGFKPPQQMVFAGVFPVDPSDYENLRDALNKLSLNDASFSWEPETSTALGFGFRCGFLGLLHMEIIQERLEREFNLDLLFTAPNVIYKAHKKDGTILELHKPSDVPDPLELEALAEPIVTASIHVPQEYVGAVIKLCEEKRGRQQGLEYLSQTKVVVKYDLPFAEIVFDFYDKLKSGTRGYASLDYEFGAFEIAPLVKMDILVHAEPVDALSVICHRDRAFSLGQKLTSKLKEFIPRQMFEVPIQAALGKKVIARSTVKAFRKNVTAKCYGGDISRKRKLLEKQKKGKARMKQVGSVEIPQEAFFAVLKLDD